MKKIKNGMISYKMNLSETMVNSLIEKVEGSKRDAMIKQSQIQQEIAMEKEIFDKVTKEATERYDKVRLPFEECQKIIDAETHTLEALLRFKTSTSDSKEIGVYNTISNTNKKPKSAKASGIKVQWREAIPALLRRWHQFKDVKSLVEQATSELPGFDKSKPLPKTYYWSAANYVKNMAINKTAGLVIYNDRIGLEEWTQTMSEHAVPKPEFLRETMGSVNGNI